MIVKKREQNIKRNMIHSNPLIVCDDSLLNEYEETLSKDECKALFESDDSLAKEIEEESSKRECKTLSYSPNLDCVFFFLNLIMHVTI